MTKTPIKLREAAHMDGDARSQYDLGVSFLSGNGVKRNDSEGFDWIKRSADQHFPDAMYAMGTFYEEGKGKPKDLQKAYFWYSQAANADDVWAEERLGDFCHNGFIVAKDDHQAIFWYKKAASHLEPNAVARLGLCYLTGQGVQKDLEAGFRYVLTAAFWGSGWGQYSVAGCYDEGIYVPHDSVQAYKWAKIAETSLDHEILATKIFEHPVR